MGNNRANLNVPAGWSQQDRRFGESIKQNLDTLQGQRGDKLDRAVTFRDLLDAGIVKLASGIRNFDGNAASISLTEDLPNLDVPPAPTNLTASGAFQNIILAWDMKRYIGHSGFEVFRHTSDVISSATLVAQVSGFTGVYSDAVGPGVTFYYWVRAINQNGIVGPYNSSTGTQGQTAPDVTFLLSTLSGAITSSQLATALATEISDATTNITSLQNTFGSTAAAATSAAAAAASQAAALLNQQGAETAKNSAVVAKTAAETAQAAAGVSATNSANSATGSAGSASTAANHASTAATAATNASNSASSASTQASNAAASATASSQSATASETAKVAAETAKSGAETAETNSATSESNASGSAASAATSATNAATAAGNAATSATAANTSAAASAASNTSSGQSATAASASQSAAATSAANASTSETNAATSETNAAGSATAAASTVNGLTARLNDVNNTGSGGAVTVEQAYSATASNAGDITDLEGQYTVKIDVNGAVAGFGLASATTAAGGITSEFIVNADRFAIMRGGSNTTAASVPFAVQASATTINGVAVPAGVYMSDAFVKNGSIVNAKIGNAAIDSAKVSSLTVSKLSGSFAQLESILTGTLNANNITTNTLDVGGKAIQDSIGRIDGTSGNDVTMTSHSEISQTTFVRNAPHHIAEFASSLGPGVSVGDVMGGTPLFDFDFTTFDFTGTRKFIITITLDPTGSYTSASETGFAFAMRATSSSGAYTSTSASDYVTTRGTSRGGTGSSSVYTLSDIVTLTANTQYYIWVFGNMDDVSTSSGSRGIRDGQISVQGLNR